jgi:tetratricopeptide (TPR) repeat protein
MVQNTLPPENSPQDAMLEQAIKFIGEEKYPKAKELLTGLLQTDQNNASYWVWLSAAMETPKERLYCLQMAYRVDPTNAAARRGLILLGALNPDDAQAPFPMNHPRPWESRLRLADEKEKPKGLKRITSNPFFRLGAIGVIAILVLGGAIFGIGTLISSRQAASVNLTPATPRPTVTPQVKKGPTLNATIVPLSDLLIDGTYTPTPIYALTPHADVASDAYRGAVKYYGQGNWGQMADMMAQIGTSQPGSVDTLYFIAEGKRLSGQYDDALEFYKQAIKLNPKFAPIYLGQARANLGINAQRSVITDLDKAINLDKNFAEAYLERGLYSFRRQNLPAAKNDLMQAASLNPGSPVIQTNLARVLLALGENEAALEAAQKAKELDITSLDAYLVIGMAARATNQIDLAVEVLDIYTKYSQTNADAFAILGSAYYSRGDYETALKNIDQAIVIDKSDSDAYHWRGEIYYATKEYDKALSDFRQSYRIHVTFDAGMGMAKTIIAKTDPKGDPKKAREAYFEAYYSIIEVEKQLKTDQQKGIYFYYRATVLEKLNEQIAASRDWTTLSKLPKGAITEEIRAEAKARIIALQSATPPAPTEKPTATLKVTLTPTLTPTPKK